MCRRSFVPSACSDKPKQETMSSKDDPDGPENNLWRNRSRPRRGRKIGLRFEAWICWLAGEVMRGLWGCLFWRGAITCQEDTASGRAWPPSLWSSPVTIPSQQLLRLWCIKRGLWIRWPKGGNAKEGASAGTNCGLHPVSRPAGESTSSRTGEQLTEAVFQAYQMQCP